MATNLKKYCDAYNATAITVWQGICFDIYGYIQFHTLFMKICMYIYVNTCMSTLARRSEGVGRDLRTYASNAGQLVHAARLNINTFIYYNIMYIYNILIRL